MRSFWKGTPSPVAPQAFEQWRRAQFSSSERDDETISGAGADPAGDGVPNLLKFAFGLEAKRPARESIPAPEIVEGELHLTYPPARNTVGVDLVVEVSTDLAIWNSGEEVTEEVAVDESGTVDLVTVRTPIFGGAATYEEDAANFSNAISEWVARTMTAPEEVEGPTENEWRTNLASLKARGLFAFSLSTANYSNKPVTPPDPNGKVHPLPSYEELTGAMRASATTRLDPPE